jgi:hypothetical protein
MACPNSKNGLKNGLCPLGVKLELICHTKLDDKNVRLGLVVDD